ncbi:MAG: hypothetical protein ACTSWN_00560 [Promethearchaeota archaeon]
MMTGQDTSPFSEIFSIKYQPQHLSEITGHRHIIKRLLKIVETKQVGHMIIAGPDGSGKLTVAKCFANDLFGDEVGISVNVIHAGNPLTEEERNEARRSSRVSATRIGSLAGKTMTWPKFIQVRVRPVVSIRVMNDLGFKLLIITDFDRLGPEQQGFRRLMEIYGRNCRFMLLTTRISSIIDPIKSRCSVFLLKPPEKSRFSNELNRIGKKEGFKVSYNLRNALQHVTGGNLGKALNYIQMMIMKKMELNQDSLFTLLKEIRMRSALTFLDHCWNKRVVEARNVYMKEISRGGITFKDFLRDLQETAIHSCLSQVEKAKVLEAIADVDNETITIASIEPHLYKLMIRIAKCNVS